MKRKAIILLTAIMLIGSMLTACTDKTQNTPTQQNNPQQRRQQQQQYREQGGGVDRVNPDGTRG